MTAELLLDDRFDLELIHLRMQRQRGGAMRLDRNVHRPPDRGLLASRFAPAQLGDQLVGGMHLQSWVSADERGDELLMWRERERIVGLLGDHVKWQPPAVGERVEHQSELVGITRGQSGQAGGAFTSHSKPGPYLRGRVARPDEDRRGGSATRLYQDERRVGLANPGQIEHARILMELEVVLLGLRRAEDYDDRVRKPRGQRLASLGVFTRGKLSPERKRSAERPSKQQPVHDVTPRCQLEDVSRQLEASR